MEEKFFSSAEIIPCRWDDFMRFFYLYVQPRMHTHGHMCMHIYTQRHFKLKYQDIKMRLTNIKELLKLINIL